MLIKGVDSWWQHGRYERADWSVQISLTKWRRSPFFSLVILEAMCFAETEATHKKIKRGFNFALPPELGKFVNLTEPLLHSNELTVSSIGRERKPVFFFPSSVPAW